MIVAGALIPVMAMIGGGVDMSRSYLSQTRLQQACDAGVLAARKKLGQSVVVTGTVPSDVDTIGQRFFDANFQDGTYGTANRSFAMTLETDYSISGVAAVEVPTTIMQAFGYDEVALTANCVAQLNMSDTDIMMVLDVTGSMADPNPGETDARIDVMTATVKDFYTQLSAAAGPQTRIRYGFMPYSTNVNVGALLEDDWVVNTNWTYQSREWIVQSTNETTSSSWQNWTWVSGTASATTLHQVYEATWHPPETHGNSENTIGGGNGYYTCDTPAPSGNKTNVATLLSETNEPYAGPPAGTKNIKHYRRVENGTAYWISRVDNLCKIWTRTWNNYTYEYDLVTVPVIQNVYRWRYKPLSVDVSAWRTLSNGCVEERDTYEITDYNNVDFTQAKDLDIDLVPTAGNTSTQWRPMLPNIVYDRAIKWDGSGSWRKPQKVTLDEYINAGTAGLSACPAPARNLATITSTELDAYLATLTPAGNTYHDIGMIWGGRLLSPTGLFATANADRLGRATSRQLIFLTDGQTEPLDLSYGTYGVEPLDERRWHSGGTYNLTETVENRFAVACEEVKKRNITVWVVGFGTTLNPMMTACAGTGRAFEASNAAELSNTFSTIAQQLGELRITN